MLIFSIDTSTRVGSLALLRDGQVLGEVSSQEETPHSTRLFRDLDILKSKAPFELSDVDLFAVASGPGSFTGLRIGLTAVKAWAEVHKRPIAAISGLEAICAQSEVIQDRSIAANVIFAPFFDARRGQLFGSFYRSWPEASWLRLLSDESILTAAEFLELAKSNAVSAPVRLVSPAPDLLPPALVQEYLPGARIERVSGVLAPTIGRLAIARAQRGEVVDALRLDANYVRRSDAESKWTDG